MPVKLEIKKFVKLFIPYGVIENKQVIKHFVKLFVPFGIIEYRQKHKEQSWFMWCKKHPKELTEKLYFEIFGKHLDWENPRDINEKIHWLKLCSNTTLWSKLADKYRVRKYVESKGLGHTLNELYFVYHNYRKIDISKLPDSFVMKVNNGSGDRLIVGDKKGYTNNQIQEHFKTYHHFGVYTAEPHYLKIKPCIIAEKLLVDKNSPSEYLIDYRFWCFNGEIKFINVHANAGAIVYGTFNENWELWNVLSHENQNVMKAMKPKSFDEMKKICAILGANIPFVRIDLYEINEQPVFGEMTFSPGAGFISHYTQEFLNELGSYLKLPKKSHPIV
ncbi:MAG: hypothetical protein LBV68_04180 [Spirochaetaceae bacterium]|jgi:hypothetical protein|nr:hypothetical protein [Spirochaetaceae bacterium]